jgi:predicted phosphodiesterase
VKAFISDIHGNLEALQAVLADIKQLGITQVYCLGDTVGYGPNPCECIDLVMSHCCVTLLGNHDQAALFDPEGFGNMAQNAILWTVQKLNVGDPERSAARWEFLRQLPRQYREGKFQMVHGSARNPLNEYVCPEDIYNAPKMGKIFAMVDQYCLPATPVVVPATPPH